MDYGKEKFGGPFTEEEVEDVKTVLRLLPLIICLSLALTFLEVSPIILIFSEDQGVFDLNDGFMIWLFPLLVIPLYQLLLYFQCLKSCSVSGLKCIGTGLFIGTSGFLLLSVLGMVGVVVTDDLPRYLSCTLIGHNATNPGDYVDWYFKLGPWILYTLGISIADVYLLQLIIAQSPDKMKGFVMGVAYTSRGIVYVVKDELL